MSVHNHRGKFAKTGNQFWINTVAAILKPAIYITGFLRYRNFFLNKAVYTTAPVAGGWAGAVMSWAGAEMN